MVWHRQMKKVKEAFKKMDYETALEGERETLEWITNYKANSDISLGANLLSQKIYSKPSTLLIEKKLRRFPKERQPILKIR